MDLDAIRLELAAYHATEEDEGYTMEDLATALGCGANKARAIVKEALRDGTMEVRRTYFKDMLGRGTRHPRYFFVDPGGGQKSGSSGA